MSKRLIGEIAENVGIDSWWHLHLYIEIEEDYQNEVENFIKTFNNQYELTTYGTIGSSELQDFLTQLRALPYVIQAEVAEYFNPLA